MVHAHVVALDQVLIWNKFGSKDIAGMVYALRRDVVASDGNDPGPGNAELRGDLRPRPLVLRCNVGDTLEVTFTNWLAPSQWNPDSPATRTASFHVSGLSFADISAQAANLGSNPPSLAGPGQTRTYTFVADHEGVFFARSMGALSGGEGDGGSTSHGLFGAVVVEPAGSTWLHSVTGKPMLDPGNVLNSSFATAIVQGFADPDDGIEFTPEGPFREFVTIFHDEAHTIHANPLLDTEFWLHSVRDAFGINYGISGIGQMLLDDKCEPECRYEEFFLTSWANGDPALRAEYKDDPSNVWHSYLGDRVMFRNVHAGPKETHVFHLHAHQWVHSPDDQNSTYLDSQSIGPGGAFSYDIAYGGSGNRNFSPGDAIFHCHLYPHFAQGMWGLWRVHDVYEDGFRFLPDGTAIPRVAPIPGKALPPLPTAAVPGYPFFIPGVVGHRPPQPPMDMVNDGGLPRHVVVSEEAKAEGTLFDAEFATNSLPDHVIVPEGGALSFAVGTDVVFLPQGGTDLEKAAMGFHARRDGGAVGIWGSVPSILWTDPENDPTPADYVSATATLAPFRVNGLPPKPGAPFADPCPPGVPMRVYKASAIDLDMKVNETGWHDPQGRINVLDGDVAATFNGQRPPEPFFVRANSNDCIAFEHTNRTARAVHADDFQVETPTDTIGQHIHLVKFDVTSSDGSGNGWNYEDATFSAEEIADRLDAMNLPAGSGFQTSVQRWWADPLLNGAGADRTIRTVFTHDHFAPSTHQQHGMYCALVVEPTGSKWYDMATGEQLGTRPDGGPTSWRADILQGQGRGIREFCLAIADFGIVYDEKGNPINPPPLPEAISASDPGTMLMNYRNEPMPLRMTVMDAMGSAFNNQLKHNQNGTLADAARLPYIFDSNVHGDPGTPIMEVVQGDDVQVRLIQGAQEESHVFSMYRAKWLKEVSSFRSGLVSGQHIGISEHFEMDFQALASAPTGRPGMTDLLWTDASEDGLWNGVWGFLRVHNTPPAHLRPLPQNPRGARASNLQAFNWPCPSDAPVRTYDVVAVTAQNVIGPTGIVYNAAHGINDDTGLMFVLAEDLDADGKLTRAPEPLIIRANAGDCLKIRLTNKLPAQLADVPDRPATDAPLPPIVDLNVHNFRTDNMVGFGIDLVYADGKDEGSNIGRNGSNLVAPNKSKVYTYYCGDIRYDTRSSRLAATPIALGVCNIRSFGDVIKQGPQGLMGALVVEQEKSTWTDPVTGAPVRSGAVAQVFVPPSAGKPPVTFKEFVLVQQDGVNLWQNFTPIPSAGDDPEDVGGKAYNYRTEPFWARLKGTPISTDAMHDVDQTNALFGADPATPVFNARVGDQIVFRLCQPAGRARAHTFAVSGHSWRNEPDNPGALNNGTQTTHSVGMAFNMPFLVPAGGSNAAVGDFLYNEMSSFQFSQGVWGILRVR